MTRQLRKGRALAPLRERKMCVTEEEEGGDEQRCSAMLCCGMRAGEVQMIEGPGIE